MDSVVRCPHQWQQSLGDEIRDTSTKLPPNGVLVQPLVMWDEEFGHLGGTQSRAAQPL